MLTRAFVTRGPGQTRDLAASLGEALAGGEVIHLHGGLGAGKTCFAQGLAKGLKVLGAAPAVSPSFTLINEYPGPVPLFHVDLYRLDLPDEVRGLGLEEYLGKGVVAVEWAEKLPPELERSSLKVCFTVLSDKWRRVVMEARDAAGAAALGRLRLKRQ